MNIVICNKKLLGKWEEVWSREIYKESSEIVTHVWKEAGNYFILRKDKLKQNTKQGLIVVITDIYLHNSVV